MGNLQSKQQGLWPEVSSAVQETVDNAEEKAERSKDSAIESVRGRSKLGTKFTAALFDVQHGTQTARSGAVQSTLSAEYLPRFKPFGEPCEFAVAMTELTLLNASQLAGIMASFKLGLPRSSSLMTTYTPATAGFQFQLNNSCVLGGKPLKTKVSWAPIGMSPVPVAVDAEVSLTEKEKFHLETKGAALHAVKASVLRGPYAVKIQHVIPGQQPVIGLNTVQGSQTYDLDYNVKTGLLAASVKSWPMSLHVGLNIGKDGIGYPTYKVSVERELNV